MKIRNWERVKRIIETGVKQGEATSTIGITILDVQSDIEVLRIGDTYTLADFNGTYGKFTSPEKAWEYMAQVCMKTYIDELDRNKNK